MKIRAFLLISILAAAGCQSVAPAPTATALPPSATPVPATPTPTDTPLPPTPTIVPVATLKVAASMPLSGGSQAWGLAVTNAMQLRLGQAGNQACSGKYPFLFEAWDDVSAGTGNWDSRMEGDNARKAVADASMVAYLGPYFSGAARVSIPILSRAGVLMISPSNTYPGLTKPNKGEPSEPKKYYPTGVRNYTRVAIADDVQGPVAANFLFNTVGVRTVYLLDDGQAYGQSVARAFESTAKSLGMKVVAHKSINPHASDYKDLMRTISTSEAGGPPEAIYASLSAGSNAAQLLLDKVAILGSNTKVKFMVPDSVQTTSFIDETAGQAEGVYASAGSAPVPEGLTEAGKKFVQDYEALYGPLTEPYAVQGYEAMNVLLRAIENICASGGDPTDRKQVREAVFGTKDFNGILGTWSFDANGDITLTDITIFQIKGGSFQVVGTFQ